ncbi:MAG: 1,4-alpha-glucan branching protein GlgB [Methylotenera sp.]|nr:1,4-alpha-glucan branching protein GlgB [Methylotenera sp.]MDO9232489.1 1,4-alpha-glucan branching protein GlgB [Methylotenera sp.]MDO9388778.1 1,4-alpha-glucan branching protein GlgB [Methylotenera sp.]MDP2101710.1 1,4-alpha-glucan branching protein GlgB [Methylotenera sp.]MDP2281499.1 1,4-alpha-glucan branching protein GlgB [Methylotenera sp.]
MAKSKATQSVSKAHTQALRLILEARHHDPFSFLGHHAVNDVENQGFVFRAFLPYASEVQINTGTTWEKLEKTHRDGLFERISKTPIKTPCLLKIASATHSYETYDPYSFNSSLTQDELYLFGEGRLKQAYKTLGAQFTTQDNVAGVRFAVWAPNAERVSVVGSFNNWDGRINPMRAHGSSGVWDIFIPSLTTSDTYKFEIRNRHTGNILVKTDPYGFEFEQRPGTSAKISASHHQWEDKQWLETRKQRDWLHAPLNCYEVHLGSWQRNDKGHFLTYRELAKTLVPHVASMGYTHIELMPISEHPLTESWGYQTTGYFGVTNRFGSPDDLRFLIDAFHQANIGVILDWVPGHFPKDDWALARFDGTALYEHEDPRLGEHQDWGTYIFNYGRNEVRNFLIANAYFWLQEFHIDGLRVDAVASMLYLDYSRKAGEWLPNKFGGRENLDVIDFLKQLNVMVGEDFAGVLTIAEESTAWPMVSRPVYLGGLGFNMKWNMGWMNDTLSYIETDPVHRRYYHDMLTFGQLYAYSENFVLPFSHDEVVHGKKSLLDKMPGDAWQKFANLRLLFTYQMTSPGKKLNFMGNEFGQGREWNVNASLDWHLLDNDYPGHQWHQGVKQLNTDLNKLYKDLNALHTLDFEVQGFEWIDCHDTEQSIVSYVRRGLDNSFVIIVLNFTPVLRNEYRIGVPQAGSYHEIFNSDANCYGGSNQGNCTDLQTESIAWMHHQQSLVITLPPLSGIVLQIK